MLVVTFLVLFVALLVFGQTKSDRLGQKCKIEDYDGKCMDPQDCPSFKIDTLAAYRRFVESNCGFGRGKSKDMRICCPETEARPVIERNELMSSQLYCNKLKTRDHFTERRWEDYIFHGEPAKIDDFPQFAALAYAKENSTETEFKCGGVLISEKFVLTAAHCLRNSDRVIFVRFGTIKLNKKPWATDVNARRQIRHPQYNTSTIVKYHDIGLVELDRSVLFTFYIWPACLYQGAGLSGETFDIAGFGLTEGDEPSNDLLKANATSVSSQDCDSIYKDQFDGKNIRQYPDGINESIICAKDEKKNKKHGNACKGDSGSGLHRKFNDTYEKRYVVGIVSTGFNCFSKLPSFYTNISPYLEWIEGIVWPQNKSSSAMSNLL